MRTVIKHLRVSILALSAAAFGYLQAPAARASSDLLAGGMSDNVVYRFTPAGARSVVASGVMADSVAFDAQGNLFVSDPQNKVIDKIAPNGTVTQFAAGQNGEDFVPGGLAFDAAGNLFAVNTANNFVYEYTPAGVRSTFASGLNRPFGVAFDAAGNLFVSEQNSGNILKFAPGGGAPTTFTSGFTVPLGLAFDAAGNLFVAEFGTGNVVKVAPNGTHTTMASSLLAPRQLTFDANGNLFVSTVGDGQIHEISPTGTQTVFASGIHPGGLAFAASSFLANISTRALVQTGDDVLIGGFIISGTTPKQVLVRAIGPSLGAQGVPSPLMDPVLSLHDATSQIASNDDWQTDPNANSIQAALRPTDPHESAILITLQPGSYTAIISGKNGTTGVALAEVYDVDSSSASQLTNISTRGLVQTGDFVMIGGFVAGGTGNSEVLIKAKGPSLAQFGISNVLADPVLRLFNSNGAVIASNDNWKDTQQTDIQATNNPPTNDLESAILINLAPGSYTAIVTGKNGGTGLGQVEIFRQ
jgi:sugar lactone lactonase YvrE